MAQKLLLLDKCTERNPFLEALFTKIPYGPCNVAIGGSSAEKSTEILIGKDWIEGNTLKCFANHSINLQFDVETSNKFLYGHFFLFNMLKVLN